MDGEDPVPNQRSPKQYAFEQQVIPHTDSLYRFAIRLRGNTDDADDLVQDTYLKAYRFWEKYDQGTNLRAWLFRIMKNSFINLYRKESKVPHTVDFRETIAAGAEPHGMPDRNALRGLNFENLIDDDVSGAVSLLPADFRTAVILRDIEGLTYEEIARFLNCPLGTVRSRIHRGRMLLRSALREYATARGYARVMEGSASGMQVAVR